MKIKTQPLYFVKSGPPKSTTMEVGCELHLLSPIFTGGSLNTTASGNELFPLAVGLRNHEWELYLH
jgi:hypothetical protein